MCQKALAGKGNGPGLDDADEEEDDEDADEAFSKLTGFEMAFSMPPTSSMMVVVM